MFTVDKKGCLAQNEDCLKTLNTKAFWLSSNSSQSSRRFSTLETNSLHFSLIILIIPSIGLLPKSKSSSSSISSSSSWRESEISPDLTESSQSVKTETSWEFVQSSVSINESISLVLSWSFEGFLVISSIKIWLYKSN